MKMNDRLSWWGGGGVMLFLRINLNWSLREGGLSYFCAKNICSTKVRETFQF